MGLYMGLMGLSWTLTLRDYTEADGHDLAACDVTVCAPRVVYYEDQSIVAPLLECTVGHEQTALSLEWF